MACSPRLVLRFAEMSLPDRRSVDFEHLYAEFAGPIYTFALRMVGDPDRAADVAQETFIKAYRKLDTLTDLTAARSWSYRIANNTAIDQIRRHRRVVPMGDDEAVHSRRPDPGPGPEAQVVGRVLDDRVERALLQLKANHRQCLLLSDMEWMSAQQIGEVLGMSHGAVRTLLCRARGEMRRQLAAEGFTR